MTLSRDLVVVLLEVLGAVLIVAGTACFSIPAAVIVAGCAVVLFALALDA